MREKEKHWLVRPETIRWLWVVFIVVLAVTVAWEALLHRHPHFGIDGIFGFNAWYGFLACAAMVVFAKGLGYLIKRPDSYYDAQNGVTSDDPAGAGPAGDDPAGDGNAD